MNVFLSSLPGSVRELVEQQRTEWPVETADWPEEVAGALPRVWACSRFVAQSCLRDPVAADALVRSGVLQRAYGDGEMGERVRTEVAEPPDEATLMARLRCLRRWEMVRIAWRELAAWASLDESLADLSALADACIESALRWHDGQLRARHGRAGDVMGDDECGLTVLGMGKLGGQELNFSSDIDLIFIYSAPGQTSGPRIIDSEDYYRRLARAVVRTLSQVTDEGFVFRVDTRLRPFGDSGPLAMHAQAVEDYYQYHGCEWERYALIKARPVAGNRELGANVLARLRPFVYRRYLDFNTFESLRGMKRLIERQVARKGMEDNIKLGRGGIREIEFIVQAFQLVRGGPEPELQGRSLQPMLARLGEQGLLEPGVVDTLREAYRFLRRVENCLQAWGDRQTHDLPAEPEAREVLACALGHEDWASLHRAIERTRTVVHAQFESVFDTGHEPDARTDPLAAAAAALWQSDSGDDEAERWLGELGMADTAPALETLDGLRRYADRSLGAGARRRLDQLMPLLLAALGERDDASTVLVRVVGIIEAISGRSTYLALLVENPDALSQLVRLCGASPWITHQLARQPILLDDLLDPRTLHTPPGRAEMERDLAERMDRLQHGDLEAEMDALRHFKQASALRVAAADVSDAMPLMVVSDHLTDLAEVVLRRVLAIAWDHMVQRYGRPTISSQGRQAGFIVVAYGKLGGIELGYASDLDLVFLHDSPPGQSTEGPRAIDHQVFFVRLGQRIIHMLSTQTAAGALYEVDMRLRPSGQAGLLVTGLGAFERYQREQAWVWEHQALVRARPVAGDEALGGRFRDLRARVLRTVRDAQTLRQSVIEMRARMRDNLEKREPGRFDLKQAPGGLTDIEFLVQHAVLRHAAEHPVLTRFTDNIRILECLSTEGLITRAEGDGLAEAYRAYRARLHRLALMEAPKLAGEDEFVSERERVCDAWRRWLGGS